MHQREHIRPGTLPDVLSALDMLDLGIVVVDGEGRITFANRAAESLLQCRRGRSIHCLLREDTLPRNKARDQRLRAALSRRARAPESYLAFSTASGKQLIVLAVPCGADAGQGRASRSILFVGERAAESQMDLRPVARLYGLTRAETRLLQALLKGKRIGDYAKQAGITLNTAKGYLKHLFGKTRVSRQSDLVRIVLGNPVLRLVSAQPAASDEAEGA